MDNHKNAGQHEKSCLVKKQGCDTMQATQDRNTQNTDKCKGPRYLPKCCSSHMTETSERRGLIELLIEHNSWKQLGAVSHCYFTQAWIVRLFNVTFRVIG